MEKKQQTVTYRARSYFLMGQKVPRYLTWSKQQWRYRWTKDAERQRSFQDYGELIDAIEEAGGPDKGSRKVIIETDTHEEREFGRHDHARWLRERAKGSE